MLKYHSFRVRQFAEMRGWRILVPHLAIQKNMEIVLQETISDVLDFS